MQAPDAADLTERFLPLAHAITRKWARAYDPPPAGLDPDLLGTPSPDPDAAMGAPVLLARLAPTRREVVERYAVGETIPEIAAARGVSGSAVRAMFDRAVREMSGEL